jgi:hypothetical protein
MIMKKITQTLIVICFMALLLLSACADELLPDPVVLEEEVTVLDEKIIDARSEEGQHEDSLRWE